MMNISVNDNETAGHEEKKRHLEKKGTRRGEAANHSCWHVPVLKILLKITVWESRFEVTRV